MASTMQQYERRVQELIRLKGGRCVRCGSTKKLQFDHIDSATKSFTILKRWALAWDRVLAEVEKCQLLCKKCHTEKSIEKGDIPPQKVHGTQAMYRHHGCRCSLCRAANAAHMREFRAKKNLGVAQSG